MCEEGKWTSFVGRSEYIILICSYRDIVLAILTFLFVCSSMKNASAEIELCFVGFRVIIT